MLKRFQYIVITFLLCFCFTRLSAKEVNGYIIDKTGKKIHGTIRLTSVHYLSGAISINNINYVPLYISVFFKENGKKRFKEFFADNIDGFSFVYDNQQIFFFSIGLPVREWGQIKMKKKFLRLLVNGYYILFDDKKLVLYGNQYTEVTDYYISDTKNRIFSLFDNNYNSLETYLIKELKMESEFLRNQPYRINLRNIKTIIIDYNKWIQTD